MKKKPFKLYLESSWSVSGKNASLNVLRHFNRKKNVSRVSIVRRGLVKSSLEKGVWITLHGFLNIRDEIA